MRSTMNKVWTLLRASECRRALADGDFPLSFPSTAKDFISCLMEKDPEKRFTCDQALEHPWWGISIIRSHTLRCDYTAEWRRLRGSCVCHGEPVLPLSSVTMALSRQPTSVGLCQLSERNLLNKCLPIRGGSPEGPLKTVETVINNCDVILGLRQC